MSAEIGKPENAKAYRDVFHRIRQSIMEKLYDRDGTYFRAEEGADRVEATASILGSLFLLGPAEAANVQQTLKKRLSTASGLKNFDPPYPKRLILPMHKVIGLDGYHNTYVWPWLTCQNISAKVKIAASHKDKVVRKQYKIEAVEDC